MIISVADWVFDVDIDTNIACSSAQASEHCTCGYCRNYYQTIDAAYPDIRPFFAQFGIDIEGPDELSPFEPTIYEATFVINGEILQHGTVSLSVDNIPVSIQTPEEADLDTERSLPYFAMTVGLLELPWVLDEPMEEVVSAANEEYYMERMWKKLLRRAENEDVLS